MKNSTAVLQPLLIIGTIIISIILSISQIIKLPPVLPVNAPLAEFSAERARKYVEGIAAEPHETGSNQIKAIEEYIVNELEHLGYLPEIQTETINNNQVFGNCRNIVAKLQGTNDRNIVLLVSHYDSVAFSPGASDNSMGVSTMLETARALKSQSSLKNSIVFLFTDMEETGSLGAYAFLKNHRWAKDVRFVINLDAGGINGPAYLVDTSPFNKQIIKGYSDSAKYPAGNGACQAFGVSSSDFNIFKSAGYPGLYMALAGDMRIHTPLDSVEHFSTQSLQHMGGNTLSLIRYYGNADQFISTEEDASYFDFFGMFMLYYPASLNLPFAGLLLLTLSIILYLGFKKKLLAWRGVLLGAGGLAVAMLVSPLTVAGIWKLISAVHPVYATLISGHAYHETSIWILTASITVLITGYIFAKIHQFKKASMIDLSIGAIVPVSFVSVVISAYKPIAGYLFIIPLFFCLIAMAYRLYSSNTAGSKLSPFQLALYLVSSIFSINLLVPVIYAGLAASDTSRGYVMSLLIVILTGLLISHGFSFSYRTGKVLLISGILTGILSAGFVLSAGFDRHHAQPSTAFYVLDSDSGKAYWGGGIPGNAALPDKWTGQFFPEGAKKTPISKMIGNMPYDYDFYITKAPAVHLDAPSVSLLNKSSDGANQILRFQIKPARKSSRIEVYLEKGQEMTSVKVNGIQWTKKTEPQSWGPANIVFHYNAIPENGIDAVMEIPEGKPVKLIVLERTYGIPDIPGFQINPRPEEIVPYIYASPLSQDTIVLKAVEF